MQQSSNTETQDSCANSCETLSMTRDLRKTSIILQIKQARAHLAALERELGRVDLGLPEPFRFDDDWVPPFVRKDHAAADYDSDRRARERGDDRRAARDGA